MPDDLERYRASKDCQQLVSWIKSEYTKSKNARQRQMLQWYTNMAFFYGTQWVERTSGGLAGGFGDKLIVPKRPYYKERKTINRTRSFVRTELAKFTAQAPTAQVVPATADDEDMRSAYAAEQAWESISNKRKYQYHFGRAAWWTIMTGNGFIKTWWDTSISDPLAGIQGDIRFGTVTPFHLFVPDLREQDIEDQPFVFNVYTKPVQWCQQYFADELNGKVLQPSVTGASQILEAGKLNLSSGNEPDSCMIYEAWLKPGAHKQFPNGAVAVLVDDILISITPDGLPYEHKQYPFTKFEHIPTATFYADSPLVDTNQLQKEFNGLRSDIADAAKRMGRPQLVAQKGSIIPSKMTNETGAIIEYRPGTQPPQPIPLAPLPQYLIDQQDRILADWEDITGQHDATKGNAPAGVTAGTAINYLQEKDDSFLSSEYRSIEEGTEKIAGQTIQLFVQYVDVPRKIKTLGSDSTFDTLLLSGSDLRAGTDIRIEKGSSVSQSQAGRQAQVQGMFQIGLIDQPTALKLLEVGGVQKVLDIMNVAERKAQRENTKMKMLKPDQIQVHEMEFQMGASAQLPLGFDPSQQMETQVEPYMPLPASPQIPGTWPPAPPSVVQSGLTTPPLGAPPAPGAPEQGGVPPGSGMPGLGGMTQQPADPMGGAPGGGTPNDPSALQNTDMTSGVPGPVGPGPVIPVDDFDVHQVHIDVHNKFRMGQEYEALDPQVKLQFALHVKLHEQAMMQKTLQSFFSQIPSDGSDGTDSGSLDVQTGAPGGSGQPSQGAGATMAANGSVPDASQGQPGGQSGA